MATSRYKFVDDRRPLCYHLSSRCVRGALLWGVDPVTGRNYWHRKRWLIDRLRLLGRLFAVQVDAFAVMDNHFHLVVCYDPTVSRRWSAEEVARRWVEVFPPTEGGRVVPQRKPEARRTLRENPERLERAREALGSLSQFMKHLKQPIARRANIEDGCTGHFFEQRSYLNALLDEAALRAAMAHVDLSPAGARRALRLAGCANPDSDEGLPRNDPVALADHPRWGGFRDR